MQTKAPKASTKTHRRSRTGISTLQSIPQLSISQDIVADDDG